jgi:hypothetical protein
MNQIVAKVFSNHKRKVHAMMQFWENDFMNLGTFAKDCINFVACSCPVAGS